MFKFLRRMILPIIMIALTGFLATIVFQWGMDITSRRDYVSANTAATINGEEVTWTQFNSVYDRFYQAEMQDADEDLSEFRKKELRTLAWQQVLHDRLLMQEVGKYQIKVSDDELYAFLRFQPPPDLQQMTYFQTDGVFDYQKYRAAMADPSVSSFWASVEPMVRIEILKQKVQATIIQTAQVTNEEIRNAYLADKEKVKVGMVNVPFSRFTPAPEGSDEDLQSYFQQHSDDYKVEERAILNVVMISKEATDYDWEIDSAQAVLIYDSLKAGGDFAELASYHSDDISAQSGGDLGWFSEGQMVGEKKKILIVEDAFELQELFRDILLIEGYDVRVAEDGVKGYDMYCQFKPDLIFTDVVMPKMSGLELVRKIRDITPRIKGIFVSGFFGIEQLKQELDAEILRYGYGTLSKPFKISEMLDLVGNYLRGFVSEPRGVNLYA